MQSSQSQTTADAAEATSETCTSSAAISYHDVENSLSSCEDQTEVKELEGIRGFELENVKLKAEIDVLNARGALEIPAFFSYAILPPTRTLPFIRDFLIQEHLMVCLNF